MATWRVGAIPTQAAFNGNGTDQWTSGQAGPYLSGDAAVIAQVGPGIQANIRFEGAAGMERPQYGILQAGGNAAIRPAIAAIGLHGGGGAGTAMIQGRRSDTDNTVIYNVWWDGRQQATAFFSHSITVPIGAVRTIKPEAASGFVFLNAAGTAATYLAAYYRASTSPSITPFASGADVSTVQGTAGKLNLTPHTDGTFLIQNNTPAERGVIITFIGA